MSATASPAATSALGIAGAFARMAARPMVYPGYIAFRVKQALKGHDAALRDDQQIIESLGDLETIGDCRYALTVKDHNGTAYRVTVEIQDDAGKAVS